MDRKIDAGNRLARYGRDILVMGPRSARMKIEGVPMRILAWVICFLAAAAPAATEAQVRLSGKVIDETKVAVSRTFVSLRPADAAVMPINSAWHTVSDPTGAF